MADEVSDYSDFDDYYEIDVQDVDDVDFEVYDPEYLEYSCLTYKNVEEYLDQEAEKLSISIHITPSLAKILLRSLNWDIPGIISKYQANSEDLLISCHINPQTRTEKALSPHSQFRTRSSSILTTFCKEPCQCPICLTPTTSEHSSHLACHHSFCNECWAIYFQVQIGNGKFTGLQCMAVNCPILASDDFILQKLSCPQLQQKYKRHTFEEYVSFHPKLQFCPSEDCNVIIKAKECKPRKVECSRCKTKFCFKCGGDYHAPNDCADMKRWLKKIEDATDQYLSSYTKDCPKCYSRIEKYGGCNHVVCLKCRHSFCWVCLATWDGHFSGHFMIPACFFIDEQPSEERDQIKAELEKYSHYFEKEKEVMLVQLENGGSTSNHWTYLNRDHWAYVNSRSWKLFELEWKNHQHSLALKEKTLTNITNCIQEKMAAKIGTWIDWHYLIDAADSLARSRHTLSNTYIFAYYMDSSSKKELFEYQQAQMEFEIENLSCAMERAKLGKVEDRAALDSHRAEIEALVSKVEKRRTSLLIDFLC